MDGPHCHVYLIQGVVRLTKGWGPPLGTDGLVGMNSGGLNVSDQERVLNQEGACLEGVLNRVGV